MSSPGRPKPILIPQPTPPHEQPLLPKQAPQLSHYQLSPRTKLELQAKHVILSAEVADRVAIHVLTSAIQGTTDNDRKNTVLCKKAAKIVKEAKNSVFVLHKLTELAQHDALLEFQARKEQKKYYGKCKKPSNYNVPIDETLGCNETLGTTSSTTTTTTTTTDDDKKKKDTRKAAVKERILVAAQETALFREAARRIRQQARELAMKRRQG